MPSKARSRQAKQKWLINDQPNPTSLPPANIGRRRKNEKKKKKKKKEKGEEQTQEGSFCHLTPNVEDLPTNSPIYNMAKTKTTDKSGYKPGINTSANGKVSKVRKPKVTNNQKRVLASAIPGELVPYIEYINDDEAFFAMVEEATRPLASNPNNPPVTQILSPVTQLPSVIPSLSDLAATALTTKRKSKANSKPKTKRRNCSRNNLRSDTDHSALNYTKQAILPTANTADFPADFPQKIAVKRTGIDPTDEEGHFDLVMCRKNKRLLRQKHELPKNFTKGKNARQRMIKRIRENAKKIELLCMIKENIQLNVQISGTSNSGPLVDLEDEGSDNEDVDNNDEDVEDVDNNDDNGEEINIYSPENILQQFEKAEAAMVNESGIVPGKSLITFNQKSWPLLILLPFSKNKKS